ncbi:MAG: hypothetical protein QM730_23990 [Anaerolineales bacterium]
MKYQSRITILFIVLLFLLLSVTGCSLETKGWFKLIACDEFTDITYNTFTNSLWAGKIGGQYIYELDRSTVAALRGSCLAMLSDKFVKKIQLPSSGTFDSFCNSGQLISLYASIDNLNETDNDTGDFSIPEIGYNLLDSAWKIKPITNQCRGSILLDDGKTVKVIADKSIQKEIRPNAGSLRASYYEDGILLLIDSERSVLLYDDDQKEIHNLLPDYRAMQILSLDRSGFWFEGFEKGTTVAMVTHSSSSMSQKYPAYTLFYYRFADKTLQTVLQVSDRSGILKNIYLGDGYHMILAGYLSWTYSEGVLTEIPYPLGIKYVWNSAFDPNSGTLYLAGNDGIYSRVVDNQ